MRNFHIALIAAAVMVSGCSKVPSTETAAREADTICQQIYQKMFTEGGRPLLKVDSKTDGDGVCHALVDVEETRAGPQKEMRTYEVELTYDEFKDSFTWKGVTPQVVARGPMPSLDSEEALFAYADYALTPHAGCNETVRAIATGTTPLWDAAGKANGCATISYRIWTKLNAIDQANPVAQEPALEVCATYANAIPTDPMKTAPIVLIDQEDTGKCSIVTYDPDSLNAHTEFLTIGKETFNYRNVRGGGIAYSNKENVALYFQLAAAADGTLDPASSAGQSDLDASPALAQMFAQVVPKHLKVMREQAAHLAAINADNPSLLGY